MTKDELIKLYTEDNLSANPLISKETGISKDVLFRFTKENNIKTKSKNKNISKKSCKFCNKSGKQCWKKLLTKDIKSDNIYDKEEEIW